LREWHRGETRVVNTVRIQIHISRAEAREEQVDAAGKAVKLMHRFTPEQVEAKMDQVEES